MFRIINSRVGAHALVVGDLSPGTTVTSLPAVIHQTGRAGPLLLDYEI
jgi:serine acetyltransferase